MLTERQQAISRLAADNSPLPAGELFTVRFYQPEDGHGVARLFYTVYGDGYPVDTFYIPERLTEENQAGRVRSVVARTDSGKVVCHCALYRSSPPNPKLFEIGLGLTLPDYRPTLAFARCNQLLLTLPGTDGIDGFFGEAVCNHTTTQKLTRQTGATETAFEPALMPARAYEAEQSAKGRVGCIMAFRCYVDHLQPLCIPDCYREQLLFMMDGLELKREAILPDNRLTSGTTQHETVRFDHAGVARCTIHTAGDDLAEQLANLEAELRLKDYALLQCFIPLGTPQAGPATSVLQKSGFFLGGFLPAWFGCDGILMQKLFIDPDFEGLQLHSERSRQIMEIVRNDWRRSLEG